MCLAQGHSAVTLLRLKSGPLHLESSTLPLSHCIYISLTNMHFVCKKKLTHCATNVYFRTQGCDSRWVKLFWTSTSILMKTAKDLEIIRGDIHIRICKNPYHTSVDVLPRLCCMRPTKSQISLGTAHSYQRLCYEYKH